jgi:hypothetical protein
MLKLKNILYLPNCKLCLILYGVVVKALNSTVTFNADKAYIVSKTNNRLLATGTAIATNLYKLDCKTIDSVLSTTIPTRIPSLQTWHCRLSHANYQVVIDMAQHQPCSGMCIDLSCLPSSCESCILGKQVCSPIPKVWEGEKSVRRLQKVFINLTRKQACISATGNLYHMTTRLDP